VNQGAQKWSTVPVSYKTLAVLLIVKSDKTIFSVIEERKNLKIYVKGERFIVI
jgi:hypothetical protein